MMIKRFCRVFHSQSTGFVKFSEPRHDSLSRLSGRAYDSTNAQQAWRWPFLVRNCCLINMTQHAIDNFEVARRRGRHYLTSRITCCHDPTDQRQSGIRESCVSSRFGAAFRPGETGHSRTCCAPSGWRDFEGLFMQDQPSSPDSIVTAPSAMEPAPPLPLESHHTFVMPAVDKPCRCT
jgi:hypothetical protein